MLRLLALTACSDTDLVPVGTLPVETSDSSAGGGDSGVIDTALDVDECLIVSVEATVATGSPTCSDGLVDASYVTVEREWLLDDASSVMGVAVAASPEGVGSHIVVSIIPAVPSGSRVALLNATDGGVDVTVLPAGVPAPYDPAMALDGAAGVVLFGLVWDGDGNYELLAHWLDSGTSLVSAVDGDAENSATAVSDFDRDGRVEAVQFGTIFDASLEPSWGLDDCPMYTSVAPTALDLGASPVISSEHGYGYADGRFVPWAWDAARGVPQSLAGAFVSVDGGLSMLAQTQDGACRLAVTGEQLWCYSDGGIGQHLAGLPTIVDADGDRNPEIFLRATTGTVSLAADGTVRWGPLAALLGRGGTLAGGLVSTDLDADGIPEVIDHHPGGVEIRRADDGVLLAAIPDFAPFGNTVGPVVADVDGDSSAEIVLAGRWSTDSDDVSRVLVLGPSRGRWARTRPVWNQEAYDITSIRDDGSIVSFPEPNWVHYNSFRFQPAHDGARPDLVPVLVESCAEACDTTSGYVELAVAAENLGSVDAIEGAEIVLSAFTSSDGLEEVARVALGETIPAGRRSTSVVMSIDSSRWGTRRVIEVVPAHDDECDWSNNRIEPSDDPCAAE